MNAYFDEVCLREFRDDDDLAALTQLIHDAYAPHLKNGLRFWGTHQTVEDTAKRFAQGRGFVMLQHGLYVGTITVRPHQPESPVALYRDPQVRTISQFAVDPGMKGRGLGKALHDAALDFARSENAKWMGLDTAAPAIGLLQMYQSWGYQVVGECDWRPHTNYTSLVLVRATRI